MKALLVVALLATTASADPYELVARDDEVDVLPSDVDELMHRLERSLSRGASPRCEIVLAKLARLGVRDDVVVFSMGGRRLARSRR